MRRRLLRGLLTFFALNAALWGVGQIVAQRLSKGDEDADGFRIAALFGGRSFHSRATALRSGEVLVCWGGADIDLRGATLDPDGAHLRLHSTLGGMQVVVPDTWRITVDEDSTAGALEVQTTPADDLPDDAPHLHVCAVIRLSGCLVAARASADAAE